MATVTSAVIAGLGAGANVASAIKQNKLQKDAQQAAKIASQNLKDIKEQNPFSGVQVPTMANKQAMDQVNQSASDSLSALQGVGAEGVIAEATGLNQGVRNAQLDIAANQNQAQFQRDAMQAEAQGGINQRQAQRDFYSGMAGLEGAQMAASDAQYNKNQAVQGVFSGLSGAIGGFAATDKYDYGTPKKTRKRKSANQADSEIQDTPETDGDIQYG